MQTLQAGPPTGQRRTGNGMEDLRSYAHVRRLCKYIYAVFTSVALQTNHLITWIDRSWSYYSCLNSQVPGLFTNHLEHFRQNPNQTEY